MLWMLFVAFYLLLCRKYRTYYYQDEFDKRKDKIISIFCLILLPFRYIYNRLHLLLHFRYIYNKLHLLFLEYMFNINKDESVYNYFYDKYKNQTLSQLKISLAYTNAFSETIRFAIPNVLALLGGIIALAIAFISIVQNSTNVDKEITTRSITIISLLFLLVFLISCMFRQKQLKISIIKKCVIENLIEEKLKEDN